MQAALVTGGNCLPARNADQPLLIHPLNLAEVLVGGVRARRGQEPLDDLHAIGLRVAVPHDGESLRLAALRVETGLKLPDCCALDTALASDSTLATFNERLARAAHARHIGVDPAAR